ncbi:MAG TPA: type II and III secretion system protein family protein [Bryobacteraceae bacterium]|jgi:pilus assembly protein CpaC|nr:type II and III secretion system protein family protein [Bryobacteraceae bacterium]
MTGVYGGGASGIAKCLFGVLLLLPPAAAGVTPQQFHVSVNKSMVLEYPSGVRRVSVANGDFAEAIAVSPHEIMINGKTAGTTSLLVWDGDGHRMLYDLEIDPDRTRIDLVNRELREELPGQPVSIDLNGPTVFLRGEVADPVAADRAVAIASVLGKVVNLLNVVIPPSPPQVLLKVRFANVDRSVASQFGVNLFTGNSSKTIGASTTGQFGTSPSYNLGQGGGSVVTDALNILLFRQDIDLGAVIQALESKQLAETLAEPNLLTQSGHPASFLAGGQFPYPTLQGGGSGLGQVTIQFRDFGIRLNFCPTVTLQGTIQLEVEPEVSSLDPANGLTVNGFTVPGLDMRRVQTQVELASGQSLVIAGLLDNSVTESLSRIPGLGDIPLLGKLFQSRSVQKNHTELLVIVTPEIVRPINPSEKLPAVSIPLPLLPTSKGFATAGPAAAPGQTLVLPHPNTVPIEVLKPVITKSEKDAGAPPALPSFKP